MYDKNKYLAQRLLPENPAIFLVSFSNIRLRFDRSAPPMIILIVKETTWPTSSERVTIWLFSHIRKMIEIQFFDPQSPT